MSFRTMRQRQVRTVSCPWCKERLLLEVYEDEFGILHVLAERADDEKLAYRLTPSKTPFFRGGIQTAKPD